MPAKTVSINYENNPVTIKDLMTAIIFCGCSTFIWHALYFFGDYALHGIDLRTYYTWAAQFIEGLHNGYYYPRWMHLANSGLGEPAFLYYSPLYFYLVAGVNYITNDIWLSMKSVALLVNWIGGVIGYLFYRKMGIGRWSFLGVLALQYSPRLLHLLMINNSLPWYSSFPAILAMFYFYKYSDNDLLNIPLSIALAIVVYCHILSAFMALLCLPFLSVSCFFIHYIAEKNITFSFKSMSKNLLQWVLSVIFGLGLSAIYLVPAMSTQNFINPSAWFFDWRNCFAFPIITAIFYGMYWKILQWGIGGFALIATIATCFYLYCSRSKITYIWFIIGGLTCTSVIALFFSSELSYPLWNTSAFLSKVQRPFRFLYICSITIPIILTLILSTTWNDRLSVWRWIVLILLGSSILFGIIYQVNLFIANKKANIDMSLLKRDFGLPEYYIAETGPKWRNYSEKGGFAKECKTADVSCSELYNKTQKRVWRIESDKQNTKIRLPLFAFPAWQVRIDGKIFPRMVDKETGLIAVHFGKGCHIVEVEWIALAAEKTGVVITIVFLLIIIIIQIFKYKKSSVLC